MKKGIKRIVFIVMLIAIGVAGWKIYTEMQLLKNGDGTIYPYEFVEDTGVYSSQGGNTINGSSIYVNEKGEVLVHFTSLVNRGGRGIADYMGNITTGDVFDFTIQNLQYGSDVIYDNVSFYENTVYGMKFIGGKGDERYQIVKRDLQKGTEEVLIEDGVNNFMVANGVFYYQTEDGLCRLNKESGEEELVAPGASGNYFFHNDKLYFAKERFIYVMSLENGETEKISEYECDWFFMYQNRIFYNGEIWELSQLMSMNPDGTNNKVHKSLYVSEVGTYGGKLYFIKMGEFGEELFYIDLDDPEFTEYEIGVREKAKVCLFDFYKENIEKRVRQFPATDKGSEIIFDTRIDDFEVGKGYILFSIESTVNSWMMHEAFVYNMDTGEVSLVNELLGLDIVYDYYLR